MPEDSNIQENSAEKTDLKPPLVPPWAKKTVPVLVSALILYYYFGNMNWPELIDKVKGADLLMAVVAMAVPQFVFWYFEALIVCKHMTWFHAPYPFWRYFWVRGAIYILQLSNNVVGGGGMLLYIQRSARITWRKFLGILLFRGGLTAWGLTPFLIAATIFMHLEGRADTSKIGYWMWWGILLLGFYWMVEGWIVWHYNKLFGMAPLIVKDRQSEFWTAFNIAGKREWYLTWLMGLPPFFFMMIGYWFVARAFGIDVPFFEYLALSPLFLFVMDLPIAFAGFGTATIAWKLIFPEYGSDLAVDAFTLFLPLSRSIVRAAIGAVSLRPAMKELGRLLGPEDDAPDEIAIETEEGAA